MNEQTNDLPFFHIRWPFTIPETICAVLVMLLLFSLIPRVFNDNREEAQLRAIRINLRIIDGAKDQWEISTKATRSVYPTEKDLGPFLKGGKLPTPVIGEKYKILPPGSQSIAILPIAIMDYRKGYFITAAPDPWGP